MLGLVSEEILLVSIVKHTGESVIVSSRRCTRLFPQIGLEFPSDREDFHVKMYILLILMIFGPCVRREKMGNI